MTIMEDAEFVVCANIAATARRAIPRDEAVQVIRDEGADEVVPGTRTDPIDGVDSAGAEERPPRSMSETNAASDLLTDRVSALETRRCTIETQIPAKTVWTARQGLDVVVASDEEAELVVCPHIGNV
jgi:hypothetical protein